MNQIQYPPVYLGIYLLLITSVLAVVNIETTTEVFLFNILFWPAIYGAGLICCWYYRKEKPGMLKMLSNILIGISFLVFLGNYLSSGLDKALVGFLIWLQAARNLTLSDRKELFYGYIISLILIFYASSINKETSFLFYITVYVLSGMFSLMADHVDERLANAKGGDKSVLVKGINLPIKGGMIAVATTTLALAIYLVVPRPPSLHIRAFPAGGGWYYKNIEWEKEAKGIREFKKRETDKDGSEKENKRDGQHEGITAMDETEYAGFQDKFDINAPGEFCLLNDIVFYLQSDYPIYARGKVFDSFDGSTWETRRTGNEKIYSKEGKFVFGNDFQGKEVGQVYTIKKRLPDLIFAAYRPSIIWFPGSVIEKDYDLSAKAPSNLKEGTIYSVESKMDNIGGRSSGGKEYIGKKEIYLQLPTALSGKVKKLGSSVTEGIDGDYQKAEAVERYLKENFRYTLNTIFERPKENNLDHFLFDSKEGHCEYFASSMVIMLRTIGIHSRMATGYVAKRYNPITGYYEVRRLDAHAWVEAYVNDYGWVAFEPTPGFQLPDKTHSYFALSAILDYVEDNIQAAFQVNKVGWWTKVMQELLEFVKWIRSYLEEILMLIKEIWSYVWDWLKIMGWKVLLFVTIISGFTFWLYRFLYPVFKIWNMKRLKNNNPVEFILHCYFEIEMFFKKRGMPRASSCSPMEYGSILSSHFEQLAPEITTIIRLFNLVRYSPFKISIKDSEEVYIAYESILKSKPYISIKT